MSIVVAVDLPSGNIELYGWRSTIILTQEEGRLLAGLLKLALEGRGSYEDITRAHNPFSPQNN